MRRSSFRLPGSPFKVRPEINVTPLVDVVLVLLIIFMVVTPLSTSDLGVDLPETSEEPLSSAAASQNVVAVSALGEVSLNSRRVSRAAYGEQLRQLLSGAATKAVFFTADESAPYAAVVTALDEARQAGAGELGVVTEVTPRR